MRRTGTMSAVLVRRDLGPEGISYVTSYLQSNEEFGKQLGRLLLAAQRIEAGIAWAFVPSPMPARRSAPDRLRNWRTRLAARGHLVCAGPGLVGVARHGKRCIRLCRRGAPSSVRSCPEKPGATGVLLRRQRVQLRSARVRRAATTAWGGNVEPLRKHRHRRACEATARSGLHRAARVDAACRQRHGRGNRRMGRRGTRDLGALLAA